MAVDGYVFLDIETTGLGEDRHDYILEIGIAHYSRNLKLVEGFRCLVGDASASMLLADEIMNGTLVGQMHADSGLADDYFSDEGVLLLGQAESMLIDFANTVGVDNTEPMCGSSIHFDRRFLIRDMPKFNGLFSYRNIDVSSLREALRKDDPELAAELEARLNPSKKHRVLEDIQDSVNLYKEIYVTTHEYIADNYI